MKVYKYSELFEANLSIQDLEKRSRENGSRGDVLVKKLINGDQLTINKKGQRKNISVTNSGDIVSNIIDDRGKYDSDLGEVIFKPNYRYEDVIDGDDGKRYKLNDIEKTPDFGSSRGSSLGTLETRAVESLQCLILAYRQFKRTHIKESDFIDILRLSDTEFNGYLEYVDAMNITKDLFENYVSEWGITFLKTANALFSKKIKITPRNKIDIILRPDIQYKFYQVSSKNGVCEAIKRVYHMSKVPSMSKWNPADIWAVDINNEQEIINEIEKHKSVYALNKVIDYYFDNRQLVGISLKKVDDKDEKIKLVINKMTKPPKYTFSGIKLSEDALSTASLRIEVNTSSEVGFGNAPSYMTVRSFSGSKIQNISGEVAGKSARQGKISLIKINEILKKHIGETVPTVKEIDKYGWDDEELKNQIENINDLIVRRYGHVSHSNRQYTENRIRLVSKYQALFLAWIFIENEEKRKNRRAELTVVDQTVEEMFHYALSIMFDITKSGRTPKYVRVVD